ncbi:hypothetical protein, partial [Gluconobacter thailandicus]
MSFSDETLVSALREYNRETARSFQKLHPFYRGRLADLAYSRASEVVGAKPDPLDVCKEILNIFGRFDRETLRRLDLCSYVGFQAGQFSGRGMKNHRKYCTENSVKVRRNIRRYIGIPACEDIVEQDFVSIRTERKKNYIVKITESGRKISAYESDQYRKSQKRKQYLKISELIGKSAEGVLLYEEFFLTLTLPGEFHASSYEAAMKEIQERWNKIMVILRKKGIIILGIKKIHLHENETPHIHATLYFKPEYEDIVREVVFSVFTNDKNRKDKAFQKTDNTKFVIKYLFKDFCRQYDEEICKIRFIGLRRNISSVWDNFDKKNYGNPTLSYLSNNRLFKARRLLDVEKNEENILFLLRAFAEPSLNEISKWHINLKHLTLTDEWKTLRIADLQFCIHGRQNILPKTRRTSFVNPEKWQFSNVFSILVKGNQEGAIHTFSHLRECVDRRFLRTRAELALCRARPPPKPSDTNDRFRIIS